MCSLLGLGRPAGFGDLILIGGLDLLRPGRLARAVDAKFGTNLAKSGLNREKGKKEK